MAAPIGSALLAYMIVILTVGIGLDIAFNHTDHTLRHHRGLTDPTG